MNITITFSYQELKKIITESLTMRAILDGDNYIVQYRDRWLRGQGVDTMEEHQLKYPLKSSKVTAIKDLRDYFLSGIDKALNEQIIKEGYETHVTPEKRINLGLVAAKNIVEKYFY